MSNWTWVDPGAGDLAACEAAKQWTAAQQSSLVDAEATVSTLLRNLDDVWMGESADAFRARLEELRAGLDASAEAMGTAGRALIEYADAVEEIAREAEPLKASLAGAEMILNGVLNDQLFGADPAGLARRYDAEVKAAADAKNAAEALKGLAIERAQADQTLAILLARTASEAWGRFNCSAAPAVGSARERANDRVWQLFQSFQAGDQGGRGFVLGDDDPFVITLKQSEHIANTREKVLEELRNGREVAVEDPSYHRTISNNPAVLLRDGFNVATGGMDGAVADWILGGQNLPESFLGSYLLEVHAAAPQPDGGVPVTYVINNDTTIDSATRIPGTGGAHLPGLHGQLVSDRFERGDWASQHQTIVWTETVYP